MGDRHVIMIGKETETGKEIETGTETGIGTETEIGKEIEIENRTGIGIGIGIDVERQISCKFRGCQEVPPVETTLLGSNLKVSS